MKKAYILGTSLVVSALLLGCGSSNDSNGGNSPQSYTSGAAVRVTTPVEAENAAAAISNLNSGVGQTGFSSTLASPQRGPSLAAVNEKQSCSNGGSMSITGDADDISANITTSYDNCDQYGITMSGSSTVVGTNNGGLVNLKMTTHDLQYKISASDVYTMNLIMDYKTSDAYMADIIYSGTIDYNTASLGSGKMGYDNFHLLVNQSQKLDLNGKVSITANQNTCQNGVYNIETISALTPTSNGYSSGTMKINGATYIYNNDGTADVTFADGTTSVITQGAALVCN